MPANLVSRINLDLLYPPFLEKLLEVLAACKERDAQYVATFGFRTQAEQAKMYFQGRTLPGKIVTNARPGLSCHNYGIAVDVVRDASPAPGLQPDWNKEHYKIFAEEGDRAGLQVNVPSGNDYGHIQLPIHRRTNRNELETLQCLKDVGSIAAAWSVLDVLGPW